MSIVHHTLSAGTRIDCYEVGRVLGVGGFGITYKAFDHTLSCDVAIKEYLPSGVALRTSDGVTVVPKSDQDQEFYSYGLNRFLEEARILAKFKAPSIVRVSRFLEENGTAYIVMDYEDGQPLDAYLKANNILQEDRLLSILIPILHGLKDVHRKGYLHRDIKPGNIYLRKDGYPVLLDFGAARQSMTNHTQAVTSMVTPGYAPIEQYNASSKQGPWTDFYGLGATLYRCVTGGSPVGAPDRIMALQAGDPDPLAAASEVCKGQYSDTLLNVIDWMLKSNIADRPQDVASILAQLPDDDATSVPAIGGSTLVALDIDTNGVPLGTSTQWRGETLNKIAKELAVHIGPLARVLVRDVTMQTSDVLALCEKLAGLIDDPKARDLFLRRVLRHTGEPDSLRINSSPVSETRRKPTTTTSAPLTGTNPITEDLIQRAQKLLAIHVGPLAKVLVRKTAQNTTELDAFITQLALEIDSGPEKKKFLAAMRK